MRKILVIFFFLMTFQILAAQGFAVGADIGWLTEMESKGQKWYNWKGEERECTALMKEFGMNAVRLRVWVDPVKHGNWCNKEDVLVKALRAKRLGMDIMVDFHYSDWWADPTWQNIPESWQKLSYKKMKQALANHTIEVLTFLKQNGINPKWVQVGNETSNGMLWNVVTDPVTGWAVKDANGKNTITKTMGHIDQNPEQYAGFIGAGYDAVKSVFPKAKVIVHLDNGFDNSLYNRNLDIVKAGGGKWDIIGMSLYPYYAVTTGMEPSAKRSIFDCMKNIRELSKKYDCDVMIVETGYEVDEQNPWKMALGREQYSELLRRAQTETQGRCKGVFYWEPECRPSQYKLGAFTEDGHPTDIMRALLNESNYNLYDRRLVEITTTVGTIKVELYNETPVHRDNFLRLANSGELNNTLFHRVIRDFMIQGGDPDSKKALPTTADKPAAELGNSDIPTETGERSLKAEIVYPKAFHKRGALASAREGDDANPDKRSSSSQFYIVWGKSPATVGRTPYVDTLPYYKEPDAPGTPWLDGGYTVFGEVIEGLDIVEKIQSQATDALNRPLNDIRVTNIKVLN